MTAFVCFCTCPDLPSAERIADALVQAQLAACVNIVPGLRSVYRWQGAIHRDDEVLLLIKTSRERVEPLTSLVSSLHPYELPELVALEIAGGLQAYLDWLTEDRAGEARPTDPATPSACDGA